MFSAFPNLFTYGLLSPFVLRVVLAFFLGALAVDNIKKRSGKKTLYGFLKIFTAFFLIVGLFTQIASLVALLISVLEWRTKKSDEPSQKSEHLALILAMAIAISLLFSGAGFFAFDLPL